MNETHRLPVSSIPRFDMDSGHKEMFHKNLQRNSRHKCIENLDQQFRTIHSGMDLMNKDLIHNSVRQSLPSTRSYKNFHRGCMFRHFHTAYPSKGLFHNALQNILLCNYIQLCPHETSIFLHDCKDSSSTG